MREWMNEWMIMNDIYEWNGMEWNGMGACEAGPNTGLAGRCRRRSVWRAQLKMECNVMEWNAMEWNQTNERAHEWIGMHKKWKAFTECNERSEWNERNERNECIHVEFHPQATFNPGHLPRVLCASSSRICFSTQPPLSRLFEFLLLDCLFSASLLFLRPFPGV